MIISPSDSSRRRNTMNKYIPGNQKHLSLEDRIYIENELNKGTSFKDIARFLCKDPTTISKEVRSKHLSDWYHKETFYNAKNFCTITHKYNYNARFSNRKYREKLHDSRSGINMTRQQLHQKDKLISPLIEQGQSPYYIRINHPELDMSVCTMYSHLDKGLFPAQNMDRKHKVSFRPRKCHRTQITNRAVFTNRWYRDFKVS
jgi:IS30 family transposase